MAVVEVEVQVAELAAFRLRVVLCGMGALEHEGLDAVCPHLLHDVILHLPLVAMSVDGLLAFGEPRHQHLARGPGGCGRVVAEGGHIVALQQAEEAPPTGCLRGRVPHVRDAPVKGGPQEVVCQLEFGHTVSMKVRCTRLNSTMPMASSTTVKTKL